MRLRRLRAALIRHRSRLSPRTNFGTKIDGDLLDPVPLVVWKSPTGREPVREWLNELPREDQRVMGRDIAKVQFGWPIGLPICRPLKRGLWEVRSSLPSKWEARLLFGCDAGVLIALHAFIKTTQKTPVGDLALARQRLKEAMA